MVNCEVETPLGNEVVKIDLFDQGAIPVWKAAFGSDPEQVYFFEYLPSPGCGRMELLLDLIELAVTARH